MNTREIHKNPDTPDLSAAAAELLTMLCFKENADLPHADVLFIFGTSYGINDIADAARNVIRKGLVKNVIIAGGARAFPDMPEMRSTEAMEILDSIDPSRFPGVTFRTENNSHNTADNVKFSTRFEEMNRARRLIYLFRSHACGRGLLTLQRHLPCTEFFQLPVDVSYKAGAPKITRSTWSSHHLSKSRVWGEFLRIERYGERGDIHYPAEARNLVSYIRKETTRG